MIRSVQVLLGVLVISGLISLTLALAPFLSGSQPWGTLPFRVSQSPHEPIVFALLFLFSAYCAIRYSQNWAIFGSLPFLALAVLPFIADGRQDPTVVRVEMLEETSASHSAALAGILSSLADVNRRFDQVRVVLGPTDWLSAAGGAGRVHDLGQPVDRTACFLTGVTGKFEGGGENGRIYAENGTWHIRIADQQGGVRFTVICLGLPV